MLPSPLKRLLQNSFVRNVGILTGGTVAAQGIMVLSLPVLTRLYTPEDFDLLAVYMALLAIFSVAACLRFNIAVPLPEDDGTAMDLFKLALCAALVISGAVAVPILLFPEAISIAIGQAEIAPYLWMVPLGVFLAATYDATQFWASRKKRFPLVARTRITRAVGGAGTQLSFGAISPQPFGLILGHMIYSGIGFVGLFRAMWRQDRALLHDTSRARLWATATAYRLYPRVSVPEALFNTAGGQLPIILIAAIAIGPEAGFLMLAIRMMGLPMGLLGQSVAQVYLAEAPAKLRDGTLVAFTRKTMWRLLQVGGPPLLLVGIASPFLFPIIFGAEWARAGVLVTWLTPWFILQFISSPVSLVLHVTGNLSLSMWLQLSGLVLRVGAVLGAYLLAPTLVTEVFAVTSAVFYAVYIVFILKELRRGGR